MEVYKNMKLIKTNKVGNLDTFIKSLVGVALVLGIGLLVLAEFGDTLTVDSAAANATDDLVEEIAGIPTWIGILIVVAMAALVLSYFYMKR